MGARAESVNTEFQISALGWQSRLSEGVFYHRSIQSTWVYKYNITFLCLWSAVYV